VIGASGTGKGAYCKERLERSHPLTLIWSPLEATDNYAGHLGGRAFTSLAALWDASQVPGVLVYVPNKSELERQFELFCLMVWERPEARVLVEEVGRVTTASYAPAAWRDLSTAGRHRGIELIATAQRPAQIDKDFVGNCTEVRCFRVNYESDAKAMAQVLRVPFGDIMQLPDGHFIHRNISARENTLGVQSYGGVPIGG